MRTKVGTLPPEPGRLRLDRSKLVRCVRTTLASRGLDPDEAARQMHIDPLAVPTQTGTRRLRNLTAEEFLALVLWLGADVRDFTMWE